jgi:hypothetical protein
VRDDGLQPPARCLRPVPRRRAVDRRRPAPAPRVHTGRRRDDRPRGTSTRDRRHVRRARALRPVPSTAARGRRGRPPDPVEARWQPRPGEPLVRGRTGLPRQGPSWTTSCTGGWVRTLVPMGSGGAVRQARLLPTRAPNARDRQVAGGTPRASKCPSMASGRAGAQRGTSRCNDR